MSQATKLFGKVRRGVQSVAYGNPLYQKLLSVGETPLRPSFTPPDPWPGDAHAGMEMLSDQISMFSFTEDKASVNEATVLRNLRSVGTEAARHACVHLIEGWLRQHDAWNEAEWAPEKLGSRIATWIGFYDFYAPVASEDLVARLMASLHRQWRHLERTITTALKGLPAIDAARGLIYGGLNFPDGEGALGFACEILQRQFVSEILPDGGHVTRNPSDQLHILAHLVDIRNILDMADIHVPASINSCITALAPVLKFYRHGDGGLALFNGSTEETSLMIDAVLVQAVPRGRLLRRLPETGYERLQAGRSLLFIDAASPPPKAFGNNGHAGLASFEFSVGRERIIVNCGSMPNGSPEWRAACAATAAHSTLIVEETNACQIDNQGGVSGHVLSSAQRFERNGVQTVEFAHNGYHSAFGMTHMRTLQLSEDGDILTGSDILQGRKNHAFTIRWHLHPTVQVSLAQGGQSAFLRTPSGSGWRLRVEKGQLALEPSIYCGNAQPRRTIQIKITGTTETEETVIPWTLSRERKA